ncbi:MAG: DUF547 domain-containing protein [Flavobacteriales bacterium]|nr:DUF547 domain-containing protein [Flavobacteriales bacterium]
MNFRTVLFLLLLAVGQANAQSGFSGGNQIWTQLLQKHVDDRGWVSYRGFLNDTAILNNYLLWLSSNPPRLSADSDEKLAFWINAYNAFTVKLILDHYPVSSIKDIKNGVPFVNSVWDIKFFEVGSEEMSLNAIEHSILRKQFDEPRIHFAIVCASMSCPQLRNEAYTADKLEQQLTNQAVRFINDTTKNVLAREKLQLSAIFKWYRKDFTKEISLKEYLRKYAKEAVSEKAKVSYLDYDWSLNGE